MACIRVKMLYSGKALLNSGKSGCIRAKVYVFGQKRLYLGKVVVFGQNCLNSVKSDCIRVKMMYSGKVVVFGQK